MDPGRVKVVDAWPKLKDKIEVESYLGPASYYRRFVKSF